MRNPYLFLVIVLFVLSFFLKKVVTVTPVTVTPVTVSPVLQVHAEPVDETDTLRKLYTPPLRYNDVEFRQVGYLTSDGIRLPLFGRKIDQTDGPIIPCKMESNYPLNTIVEFAPSFRDATRCPIKTRHLLMVLRLKYIYTTSKFGDIKIDLIIIIYKISKMDQTGQTGQDLEKEYVKQLTPFQKIAYDIAVKKLESSFNLTLSIGFLEFVAARPKIPETLSPSG